MSNARKANSRIDRDRPRFVHRYEREVKKERESEDNRGPLTQRRQDQPEFFDITNHDVVFVTVPMTDARWFNLFEACVANGAHIILPSSEIDPARIAKTIREEGVTVLAVTSKVWSEVSGYLQSTQGSLTRIRTLIFNGRTAPENRTRLILTGVGCQSKSPLIGRAVRTQSNVHRDYN
jgi:hypothetical protein